MSYHIYVYSRVLVSEVIPSQMSAADSIGFIEAQMFDPDDIVSNVIVMLITWQALHDSMDSNLFDFAWPHNHLDLATRVSLPVVVPAIGQKPSIANTVHMASHSKCQPPWREALNADAEVSSAVCLKALEIQVTRMMQRQACDV